MDDENLADAFARLHADMERVAGKHVRYSGTLDVPAILGEVYLRLHKHEGRWNDTGHFLAVACRAMGQIASNHYRDKAAQRRGGDAVHVTLSLGNVRRETLTLSRFLDLRQALDQLEATTPEPAHVFMSRAFVGLSVEETAKELNLSPATVKRRYQVARAFLRRHLADHHDGDA